MLGWATQGRQGGREGAVLLRVDVQANRVCGRVSAYVLTRSADFRGACAADREGQAQPWRHSLAAQDKAAGTASPQDAALVIISWSPNACGCSKSSEVGPLRLPRPVLRGSLSLPDWRAMALAIGECAPYRSHLQISSNLQHCPTMALAARLAPGNTGRAVAAWLPRLSRPGKP